MEKSEACFVIGEHKMYKVIQTKILLEQAQKHVEYLG